MFERIKRYIKSLNSEAVKFDPSVFNDPVAMTTEWEPARSGGSNFRTHKLVEIYSHRLEFKLSSGIKIFSGLFIGVGLILWMIWALAVGLFDTDWNSEVPWILLGCGGFFNFGGWVMWYSSATPVVFDKQRGWFWRGRKGPREVYNLADIKHGAKLEEIHALQLISEYVSSDKTSYYSYELNVVLKDGKRINAVDHGNAEKLIEDADHLAQFLNVPVWNAI